MTAAQYLTIINLAVDDLKAAGIVLPLEEDESITMSANTWFYEIPAGFAYLWQVRQAAVSDTGTNTGAADTTLTDTTKTWSTNQFAGGIVTCNSKTMTVISNTATVLTGASWSGGGNPGSPFAYTVTSGKYANVVSPALYRVTYDGSKSIIQFDENDFTPTVAKLKLIGQKRVAALAGGDTVPIGLEGFLRERGIALAGAILSGGGSQLSQQRLRLSEVSWGRSLELLTVLPRDYRPLPDAQRIPER